MVGRLVSFLDSFLVGAMLVSGRVGVLCNSLNVKRLVPLKFCLVARLDNILESFRAVDFCVDGQMLWGKVLFS